MKSLAFIVTDRCNVACDFCAPGCGRHLSSHLDAVLMKRVFSRLNEFSLIPVVVFTGGEPFLFEKEIVATIAYISRVSNSSTRIVTNASWATSFRAALRILKRLKDAGLSELNYSVDDFHQVYIPEARIRYAVDAAFEVGIPVLLAHKTYKGSKSGHETYERLLDREIPVFERLPDKQKGRVPLCISTGYTIPIGRGAKSVDLNEWLDSSISEEQWRGPCNEILNSIVINAQGKLSPCCGLVDRRLDVFYMGNVYKDDIIDILEQANKTVLYNWLALSGPSGIMDYIKNHDCRVKFLNKYVQTCHLCNELFSDPEKKDVVLTALEEMAYKLCSLRCVLEAQRESYFEKFLK